MTRTRLRYLGVSRVEIYPFAMRQLLWQIRQSRKPGPEGRGRPLHCLLATLICTANDYSCGLELMARTSLHGLRFLRLRGLRFRLGLVLSVCPRRRLACR